MKIISVSQQKVTSLLLDAIGLQRELPMSAASVESVIRKSVIDVEFRQFLLNNPNEALVGYDLTDEERAGLCKLDSTLFDASGAELEQRLSRVRGGWDAN